MTNSRFVQPPNDQHRADAKTEAEQFAEAGLKALHKAASDPSSPYSRTKVAKTIGIEVPRQESNLVNYVRDHCDSVSRYMGEVHPETLKILTSKKDVLNVFDQVSILDLTQEHQILAGELGDQYYLIGSRKDLERARRASRGSKQPLGRADKIFIILITLMVISLLLFFVGVEVGSTAISLLSASLFIATFFGLHYVAAS